MNINTLQLIWISIAKRFSKKIFCFIFLKDLLDLTMVIDNLNRICKEEMEFYDNDLSKFLKSPPDTNTNGISLRF
jgi:hypothetical protein